MKTSYLSSMRAWGTAALAALCLFAFTTNSYADRHKHKHSRHNHSRVIRGHDHHHHRHWNRYHSYPRSRFIITFGTGYAGRGYYYGPPGMPYYYRAPGVVFYSSRARVPSRYW